MKSNGKKQKWFLIIEICLGMIFLFQLLTLIMTIHHDMTPYLYDTYDMERTMTEKNYPELKRMLEENEVKRGRLSEEEMEYQAIADFYESAMMYYGYEKTGDTEQAEKYQLQMKESRDKLTTEKLLGAAQEIQEQYEEKLQNK